MSSDVLKQLVEILFISKHSLQIDESTLSDNKSLQMGYMRFIHNMQAQKEMIFAINFPVDTQATTVFNAVEKFYEEKEILMQNILQRATDGTATMVKKHRGFITLMKKKIPNSLQLTTLYTGNIWSPVISLLNCITHCIL